MPNAPASGVFPAPSSITAEEVPPESPQGSGWNPLPRLMELSGIVNPSSASWHSPLAIAEQRGCRRIDYQRRAVLTFLDDRTNHPTGEHRIVSGRDISLSGFSFTHVDPLACRRAIVTFASELKPWAAVVLRLCWCRFTKSGLYQSGGKFLSPIPLPFAPELNLDDLPHA